jgi:hypothetical protein
LAGLLAAKLIPVGCFDQVEQIAVGAEDGAGKLFAFPSLGDLNICLRMIWIDPQ